MATNYTLPFQLDDNLFRGRYVRLTDVMNTIIRRHDYPAPVARLLGETMLLCASLAGALKYAGIFTLQAKGDGAITNLVADVTSDGAIRAYASFNRERVEVEDPGTDATALLLGKGYIAFTVDQGGESERYQGIVELSGRTIADCVAHYFRQSEQIPTGFVVAAQEVDNNWQGSAIMLQRMPRPEDDRFGGSGRNDNADADSDSPMEDIIGELSGDNDNSASAIAPSDNAEFEARAEDIRRKMILLGSAKPEELLDHKLDGKDLLFRLFHDDNLTLSPPQELHDECRCSRARVERVLRTMPAAELNEMKVDGKVNVTCEFCNRSYDFDDSDIDNLNKVFHLDIADGKAPEAEA